MEKMCAIVRDVVDRDYVSCLRANMEDVYSTRAGGGTGIGAGAGGQKGEKAEKEARTTFMVRVCLRGPRPTVYQHFI